MLRANGAFECFLVTSNRPGQREDSERQIFKEVIIFSVFFFLSIKGLGKIIEFYFLAVLYILQSHT